MSGPGRHAVAAGTVFDGAVLHVDCAVVIEGARILGLGPRRDLPAGMPVTDLPEGAWLAPGFVDVQVNGGGDVLFNDAPSPEGLAAIAAAHRRFGTTALLPTLISDTAETMRAARRAVEHVLGRHPGILGIHFEGPFLSPERPGVHDPAVLRRPEPEDIELVAGLGTGVTLVTLAPEVAPAGFVARLAAAGAKVSLGHSMATYDETRRAMAEGLTGFTHLFNAMRPLGSREPGPIAAALEAPDAFIGLIADGVHVHPSMLKLALRGAATPILVTDAMPCVGGRPGFRLYGQEISVRDGRCVRGDGTLAGAALDMASAVRNAVHVLGVPLPRALAMASRAPADFLGLRLGRLGPGYRADLVALDPGEIRVIGTWLAGDPA